MNISICFLIALFIGTLARPPTASGQYFPRPSWPKSPSYGPRERRAIREKVIQHAGPESRAFVEAYGEDAVAAICASTPLGIQQLIEFHASGGLDRLSRPRALLRAVAHPKHGDDVIVWAAAHEAELVDPDHFEAFLQAPLEYALDLKSLAEGVQELRAARLPQQPVSRTRTEFAKTPDLGSTDPRRVAVIAGALAIIGLLLWWRRKRRQF